MISDSAAPSCLPWDLSELLREVQLVGLFAEPARAQELCTPQTVVGIGPSSGTSQQILALVGSRSDGGGDVQSSALPELPTPSPAQQDCPAHPAPSQVQRVPWTVGGIV